MNGVRLIALLAMLCFIVIAGCMDADLEASHEPMPDTDPEEEFEHVEEGPKLHMSKDRHGLPFISFANATMHMSSTAKQQMGHWLNLTIENAYHSVTYNETIHQAYWLPMEQAWNEAGKSSDIVGIRYNGAVVGCFVAEFVT